MFEKVAVVGESDFVFGFKALGFKVFTPKDIEEARKVLETVKKENFALCFLHQSLLEPLKEERKALGKKFCPVVVGFRDYREITDQLENIMKEIAVKATGSDSLVKRKGKNERR